MNYAGSTTRRKKQVTNTIRLIPWVAAEDEELRANIIALLKDANLEPTASLIALYVATAQRVRDSNRRTGLEGRSFTRDIDGVTPVLTRDFPGFRSRGIGSVGKPQPSPGLYSEITFPKWESPMSPSCGAFVTQNFHFSQDKSVILKRAAKRADYTRYSKDPKNWIAV